MDDPHLFLVRFTQTHADFRAAELDALARLLNSNLPVSLRRATPRRKVRVQVVRYEAGSPFCVVRFRVVRDRISGADRGGGGGTGRGEGGEVGVHGEGLEVGTSDAAAGCDEDEDEELLADIAARFIKRSVQAKGIYEIWGHAVSDAADPLSSESLRTSATHAATGPTTDDAAEIATVSTPPTTTPAADPTPSTIEVSSTKSGAVHPLYSALHASTRALSGHRWERYRTDQTLKFKLSVDSFNRARSAAEQRDIINSFAYLDFAGLVRMKDANEEWVVFEEWLGPPSSSSSSSTATPSILSTTNGTTTVLNKRDGEASRGDVPTYPNTYRSLKQLFFTRAISTNTLRPLIETHDLKKRPYISTTSMDAELALVTANLALAGPGKIFLDPFCGTGGFLVAAAELGSWVLGSDIDGRSFRGKGGPGLEKGVGRNLAKYGLQSRMGGCLTGDLINTPLMLSGDAGGSGRRWLDGIIADPPYGVREGLKVLGARKPLVGVESENGMSERKPHLIEGVPAHTLPGYVAPKKPYSFERMLDDILEFAVRTLVDGGRLAFWMPSANENERGEEEETRIPRHPGLLLQHVCVQRFNRWSRRLLVYERRPGDFEAVDAEVSLNAGARADDLNPFRRRYFQAFAPVEGEPGGNGWYVNHTEALR